jgi:hypothetical protein
MSVYRDDPSGLAARLADLRAVWQASAAEASAVAQSAIVRRASRLWAARVGVAIVALLVASLVVSLATGWPAAQVRPLVHGHVDDNGPAMMLMVALPFFSVLAMLGIAVAKHLGGICGEHVAKRRLRTLLAGDTSAMEPARALAYLTEETPGRVLLEEGRRLERASILLHLATSPWATFMLVFMFLARFVGDARGIWLQFGIFMAAVWLVQVAAGAVLLTLLHRPRAWPSWKRDLVIILAVVALVAAIVEMPATGWFLLVHVITLGFRAHWLRRDVLLERAALC